MPEVVFLKIKVDPNDITAGCNQILNKVRPNWTNTKNINHKIFGDGISNKMYGFFYENNKDDMVLIRINGNKTEVFLDRDNEVRNFQLLHDFKCASTLYCRFENGLCYEFIPGVTLTKETVRDPEVFKLTTKAVARMHSINAPNISQEARSPILFDKIDQFLQLIFSSDAPKGREIEAPYSKDCLEDELQLLKEKLSCLSSPTVFAHNDLLLNNVIYNKGSKEVRFIDYEYAGFNYAAFDIGNHFCEFAGVEEVDFSLYPNKQLQHQWLRSYLEEMQRDNPKIVSDQEVQTLYVQVNKFALAAHFFWGVWSLMQAKYSAIDFDFVSYAKDKIGEYFNRKEEFLTL